MKNIYIVVSQTGTFLSVLIKLLSKKPYSHVSISNDPTLQKMYSFGRLNPYNPFWGGYVEEGKNIGTFKRFKNTKCKVYSMEVTEEQYDKLITNINYIKNQHYKFNFTGLLKAKLNRYTPKNDKFFCSEFVKYVLEKSDVNLGKFPEIPHPNDFSHIPNKYFLYKGLLKNYDLNNLKRKID